MKPKSRNCSKLIILLSLTLATLSFFSWIKPSNDPTCWFGKFCLDPRPGLAQVPYAVDSCGQRSDTAWVMMGDNEAAFQQILVSAKSLRSLHTKGDIVVLNFARSIPKCMQTAFQGLCIRVKNVKIPVTRDDVTNPIYKKVIDDINKWWDFAKLLAYDMIDYSKVVFVDGDTMFLRDPDVWLAQPPGTYTDGPKSPFNSGMFVLEPSSEDFMTLLGLVRNGTYDLKTGWGGAFRDDEKKYVFSTVFIERDGGGGNVLFVYMPHASETTTTIIIIVYISILSLNHSISY